MKKAFLISGCIIAGFLLWLGFSFSQAAAGEEIIGEAFGQPVTAEEFNYYYKTASLFTRAEGEELDKERTDEQVRAEAWQNLIFTHEAKALGILVSQEELEQELSRLVGQMGVEYPGQRYALWVASNFHESPQVFEGRIEDLLRINKFMQIKSSPEIVVTEEEMKEKFLNQYNSFESEYILFESKAAAEDFARQCRKNPRLWFEAYQEKKPLGQKGASWINIMSLEALIDLWKIPREDAYRIIESKEGDFIAAKNYYGDVLFRLLSKRRADLKDYDEKRQEYYRNLLTQSRRQRLVRNYFEGLLQRAGYRDYIAEKKQAEKIAAMQKKSILILETNRGNIELRLFPEEAPLACENFIGLVEGGYYNGTIFHRVISDFMIQGGDPTGSGAGGESFWGDMPFVDEFSDKLRFDQPGILAMANSGPNTNRSQFFITVSATPGLEGRHTIFGQVVAGLDVIEMIANTPTDDQDRPIKEKKIIKAYIRKTSGP